MRISALHLPARSVMIATATLTLACALTLIAPQAAYADASVTPAQLSGTHTFYLVDYPYANSAMIDGGYNGYKKGYKITSLKSSNTKVAKIVKHQIDFKRPGATTITCTYASKKYTSNIRVEKYVSPFTALKIGGTSYLSKTSSKNFWGIFCGVATKAYQWGQIDSKTSIGGKKLAVKLKAGWQIVSIRTLLRSGMTKIIKNGSVLPKTAEAVTIYLNNPKKHGYLYYRIES